jgi:hypothetical protein
MILISSLSHFDDHLVNQLDTQEFLGLLDAPLDIERIQINEAA